MSHSNQGELVVQQLDQKLTNLTLSNLILLRHIQNQRGEVCSALCNNFDNQLPPKGGWKHIPRGDYEWCKECYNGCVHVLLTATKNINLTKIPAKFVSLLPMLTNQGMTRHSPYSDPNRSSPPFGGYPPAIQAKQERFFPV